MQTGLILAVIASIMFSAGIIIVRKTSAAAGESFSVAAISILVGIPFFAVAVTVTGDWDKILTAPWRPLVLLASAGVLHFIFGRLLGYSAYRLIGANKATPFIMTDRFYTLLFCFLFLGEPVTGFIIGGVLCMFFGAAMISTEKKSVAEKKVKGRVSNEVKGILLALVTALFWGTTPVLIKPGVEALGSSVAGAFVSYGAAAVVMLGLLLNRSRRQQVTRLPLVQSLAPMALAGLCTAAGQLLYYTAMKMSPANIVTPLLGVQVIFIFLLSFLINRRIEVFSWKVALGMVATLAGTFLLFH